MSSARVASRRYVFLKLYSAAEEAMHSLFSGGRSASASSAALASSSVLSQAISTFQDTYKKQMTTTMYIAGGKGSSQLACMSQMHGSHG